MITSLDTFISIFRELQSGLSSLFRQRLLTLSQLHLQSTQKNGQQAKMLTLSLGY